MTQEQSLEGTIEAHRLQTVYMGDGEGKPDRVIANNILMLYIGIGWGRLREATKEDYLKYPIVVYSQHETKKRKNQS